MAFPEIPESREWDDRLGIREDSAYLAIEKNDLHGEDTIRDQSTMLQRQFGDQIDVRIVRVIIAKYKDTWEFLKESFQSFVFVLDVGGSVMGTGLKG